MALVNSSKGGLTRISYEELWITGADHYPLYSASGESWVGVVLTLQFDLGNSVDPHAIRVLYAGTQLGWVWREQNLEVARSLNGRPGYLKVVEDRGSDVNQMRRLSAHLYVADAETETPSAACNEGWPYRVPKGKLGVSCDPEGQRRWDRFWQTVPDGTVLRVLNAPGRRSMSVLTIDGSTACWVYKRDLPEQWHAHTLFARKVAGGLDFSTEQGPPTVRPFKSDPTDKENTMSLNTNKISYAVASTVEANKNAAVSAAYLTAGKIANKQLGELAGKALPLFLRSYATEPVGQVVVANLLVMAARQLRPSDQRLARLGEAAMTAAYAEVAASFDIEGMVDKLLKSAEISRALDMVSAPAADNK